LAMLMSRDGQIIHQACYGQLHLAKGSPIVWNSLFRIASLTKPITAVATLMLHEQGYFDLRDPISKWIPEFKNLKVWHSIGDTKFGFTALKKDLTFWHLLPHPAGFGYGFEPGDPLADLSRRGAFFSSLATLRMTLPELIRKLVQLPLASQPG